MKVKYIILLLLTVFITTLNNVVIFDNNDKVDLFLFSEIKQTIEWYIFDSATMINYSILLFLLFKTSKIKIIRELSCVLFIFSIVNIANYWLTYNDFKIYVDLVTLVIYLIINIYKLYNAKIHEN